MMTKVFVIALFALICVHPSFQATTWDWFAYDDDTGGTDVGEYEHHRLDYVDTVGLNHKKKWHPKAHTLAHAKPHAKPHAPAKGKKHAALGAHAAAVAHKSKRKHKPIPPKKVLDNSEEDEDEDEGDKQKGIEHTKDIDEKLNDSSLSNPDRKSDESSIKTTEKTLDSIEQFLKAREAETKEDMTSTTTMKSCCSKHHHSQAVTEKNTPKLEIPENVGYFRRMGRFLKNLFTWSSDDDDDDDDDK